MARKYNAGSAFVTVTPVFGNFQKDLGDQVKRKLGDDRAFERLGRQISESIEKGFGDLDKRLEGRLDKVTEALSAQVKKAGKVAAKDVKTASGDIDKAIGAASDSAAKAVDKGAKKIVKRVRDSNHTLVIEGGKIAKIIDNNLGKAFNNVGSRGEEVSEILTDIKNRSKELHAALGQLEKGGSKPSAVTAKYKALRRAIGELIDAQDLLNKSDQAALRTVAEELPLYDEIIGKLRTRKEARKALAKEEANAVAEQKRLDKEAAESAARREAAINHVLDLSEAQNKARRDRDLADHEIHERKKTHLTTIGAKARRAAELEGISGEDYFKSMMKVGRDQFNPYERRGINDGSARERRAIAAQRKAVDAARRSVQNLMKDLGALDSTRFQVRLDSRDAVQRMRTLTEQTKIFRTALFEDDLSGLDDTAAREKLRDFQKHFESIGLEEIDLNVNDKEARRRLTDIHNLLKEIQSFDISLGNAEIAEKWRQIGRDIGRDFYDSDDDEGDNKKDIDNVVKKIKLNVDKDDAQKDVEIVKAALETLRDKKIGVDISDADAHTAIRLLKAALAAIRDKDVDIDVDVHMDALDRFQLASTRAEASLGRLNRTVQKSKISFADTTQAFRVFNPMLAGVAVLGAPAVSAIGALTAALGGLAAMLPGVVGGIAPMAFALKGLGDATTKFDDAQEALAVNVAERTQAQKDAIKAWEDEKEAVGGATTSFIEFTRDARDSLRELQRHARDGFLPGLQSGLELIIDRYADPFGAFLERTGSQLGDIAERWGTLLSSDSAASWFGRVGEDSVKLIADLGISIENFARGFAGLTDAFRPFMHSMSDWLVDWTGRFADWAENLPGNGKFLQFLDSVLATSKPIRELFAQLGELVVTATIALEPFTVAILNAVNGALDFINAMDPKILGMILGAVGGLTAGLMLLSGVMAGIGAVTATLSAVGLSFWTKLAASVGGFVAVNSAAIGTMAVADSGATDLGGSIGSLGEAFTSAADFARDLWGFLGDIFDAISPLIPAVIEVTSGFAELGTGTLSILLDLLSPLVDVLGAVVDVFTALPTPIQSGILAFGGVATALTVLGGPAGLLTQVSTGLSGIAGLIGGAAGVWDGIKVAVTATGGALNTLTNGGLSKLGTTLTSWVNPSVSGLAKEIVLLPDALHGAKDGVGKLAGAADDLAGKSIATKSGVSMLGMSLTGLGVTAGVAAVSMGLIALEAYKAERATKLLDEAVARLGGPDGSLVATRESMDSFFANDHYRMRAGRVVGEVNSLDEAMLALKESSGQLVATFAGMDAEDKLKAMSEALSQMVSEGNVDAAIDQFQMIAESADAAGIGYEQLTDKYMPEFIDSINKVLLAQGREKLTAEEVAALYEGRVPESVRTAVDAYQKQKGIVTETEQATRDLINAEDELAGRRLSAEEAMTRLGAAQIEFNEHIKTATGGLDTQTESGIRNREAFERIAEATSSAAMAQLEADGDAQKFTETMWAQREELVALAKRFGMTDSEAKDYANTLLGIPEDVRTEAQLIDHASAIAKEVKRQLDALEDKTIKVELVVDDSDIAGIFKRQGPGKSPGPWKSGYIANADGNIVEFMANGGLRPMSPVAQMVPPNTWRVVGDRSDVDEAYVPLDGSKRSISILFEAMTRMPGLFMHDGGIINFAAGAIATPTAAAPGAYGEQAGDLAGVSKAFADLAAALGEGWKSLMDLLIGETNAFFQASTDATLAWVDGEKARWGEYYSWRDSSDRLALEALGVRRDGFFAADKEANESHYWALAEISDRYRAEESVSISSFFDAILGKTTSFGNSMRSEWARIWSDLAKSTRDIFSTIPQEIGNILSDVATKMNKHIVGPFNKIVGELDLKDSLKLDPLPTQKYASGGIIRGYTPGRDVHTFVSPTGGVLELSGGEPVLRPEAGRVLGKRWVDDINAAAIHGGTAGVRRFLGGFHTGGFIPAVGGDVHQSFSTGGMFSGIKKDRKGIIQLGKLLQSIGVRVSEHPAFGGVGRHAPRSWHYSAGALDLNTAPGTSAKEMADFDRIMPLLYKLGWGVIWRYPNHFGHAHVDIGNRSLGAFNRNPNLSGDLWEKLKSMRVGPATGGMGGDVGFRDIKSDMEGFVKKAREDAKGYVQDFAVETMSKAYTAYADANADEFFETAAFGNLPGGAGNFGGGVERWRPLVVRALEMLNQPTSEGVVSMVLRRMNQESGGNPRAINNWDINARRGTPSKGLMQVIGPTFRAYAHPGYNKDIWDPLSNILAGMRWSIARYGSIAAGFNRRGGYAQGTSGIDLSDLGVDTLLRDNGGPLPEGYSLVLNNLGHEETIIPQTTESVARLFHDVEAALGESSVDRAVHFYDATFYADPQETAEAIERTRRLTAAPLPSLMG